MKKLLFYFSVVFAFAFSNAQCTATIFPFPGCIPVTSNQSINATGSVYWICSGLTVTILSSEGDLFLCESNVTLNIVGSAGDQIFAKSGCIINNASNADIGVSCNPTNVTLNNTGTGSLTVDAICNPVVYDYALVGGSGSCATTSIGDNPVMDLSIYPNPFNSSLTIAGMTAAGEAILYNVLGKEVQRWQITTGENYIATNTIVTGVYLLSVKTSHGVSTIKLIKQ